MFDSVSINNFRCFDQLEIDGLAPVNLIAGRNSSGKTALLEALFLLCGQQNISLIVKIGAWRGVERTTGPDAVVDLLFAPLFPDYDPSQPVHLAGNTREGCHEVDISLDVPQRQLIRIQEGSTNEVSEESVPASGGRLRQAHTGPSGETNVVQMEVTQEGLSVEPAPPQPSFRGIFQVAQRDNSITEQEVKRFGQLEVRGEVDALVEALHVIEPRLEDISTVFAEQPMLYADIGFSRMIPMSLLGDGLGRFAAALIAIASASGGVVLIDEVENGLHHSVMTDVWHAILSACRRYDTQLFATTHSWECIESAYEAFSSVEPDDLRFHRLERENGAVKSVTYDADALQGAIEGDVEVR